MVCEFHFDVRSWTFNVRCSPLHYPQNPFFEPIDVIQDPVHYQSQKKQRDQPGVTTRVPEGRKDRAGTPGSGWWIK